MKPKRTLKELVNRLIAITMYTISNSGNIAFMENMSSIANFENVNQVNKIRKIKKAQIKYLKVLRRYILEGFYVEEDK